MKTSELIKALDKIRNEIIFKLVGNSIISTLVITLLVSKFVEYFNSLAGIFLFGGIIASFIFVIYFTVSSVDKYTEAYRQLINKM